MTRNIFFLLVNNLQYSITQNFHMQHIKTETKMKVQKNYRVGHKKAIMSFMWKVKVSVFTQLTAVD
jgi:hypothetical protein